MKIKIPHLILAGLLGTSITSLADTVVWDGDTDNTWGAGTNWVGDPSPPTNGDDLTFSGTVQTSTSNDLAAGTDIAGIQFTNTTGGENFTLAGNAIDLTGNITTTAPLANGDGILLDTISLNMQLTGGDRTFTTNQFDANDRHDITVSGVISEDASPRSLIKEGSSFLYLSGTNTYTGATTINAGRLYLGNSGTTGSLDTASTISIASGAALEISQSDDVTQGTDFSGAAITGAGQLRKSGAGTLILNTANTYNGGTFINRSPVQIEHNDALGTGAVTLWQTNAELELVDGITLDNDITIVNNGNAKFIELVSGSATISSSSTITTQETSGVNARFRALNSGTLTLDAQITGAGGIAANAGTVILTNAANNYTGQTYVTAGTLQINDGAAVSNTSSILLRGSNVVLSLADGVTVDRNLTAQETGVNKTLQVDNAGTTSATYSGGITIQETSLNAFDLDAGADDTLTISGVISGTGAAGVTKEGTGTAILTNTNTHTGNTTVSAGTLQISGGGSLSTSSAVVNNANLNYGTTIASDTYGLSSSTTGTGTLTGTAKLLQLNGDITQGTVNLTSGTSGSLHGQGIELVSDTTITADNITLTGDLGHSNSRGGTLALDTSATNGAINLDVSIGRSGDWYGFNSFAADAGTGTLTVSGANAGSGGWRGTSSVSLTGNLDISSSFTLAGSGVGPLDLTATGNSSVTGDLALANTTNTWTVNPGLTMDVSGAISGTSAAINKEGTGTLNLTGANTYSGNTTVSDGTLSLATGSTHSGTGAYTVEGGILKIATGVDLSTHAMTIGLGGVISPGNSPGTAITGTQTWTDGGSYLWEINNSAGTKGLDPGWDWLDITGTLELGSLNTGAFTIDIDSLSLANSIGDATGFETWSKGDGIVDYSFIIASASAGISGFDATDFSFDSSGFSNGPSWDWQIKLSGTDLVLEAYAVPEPSSTALLGLGGLALMLRRKRS